MFFHPGLQSDSSFFQLEEETRRHVVTVLRMSPGEHLMLTNGKGLVATAAIVQADKKQLTVNTLGFETEPLPSRRLAIGISLLKNATRFEWMLEKVTEIGITEIFPLVTERTERQHFRKERFGQILVSASLQSQRFHFPLLHDPLKLEQLVSTSFFNHKYIAHCMDGHREKLVGVQGDGMLLIGPEGDFTTEEVALAMKNGYIPVSLGETRLRTETAGIVGAVLLRG